MVSKHPQRSATELKAATRRVIIGVAPDYFAWPAEVQERYRATLPKEDRSRIRQSLLKTLFGINTATCADAEAVIDSFDDAQYLLLNNATLPLTGIGDDCFFLNEGMADGTSLLDFETLYDYDHADHCFQEAMRQKDKPGTLAKPYRGTPYWRWACLQIGGVFNYANLCLLAGYVSSKLDEFGFDKINALIPHTYVNGKDHGKRDGNGILFDLRVDAGGLEGQLDKLNERYAAADFLEQSHQDILRNLDPKVVKLRKKRKIILTDDVAKDLLRCQRPEFLAHILNSHLIGLDCLCLANVSTILSALPKNAEETHYARPVQPFGKTGYPHHA